MSDINEIRQEAERVIELANDDQYVGGQELAQMVVQMSDPPAPPEVEHIRLVPMACACGDRQAALDAKVAAGDWTVDKLIYELQWVRIKGEREAYMATFKIVSDMWMRVTMELSGENPDETSEDEYIVMKTVSVECDRVLDGLLRLREYFETGE